MSVVLRSFHIFPMDSCDANPPSACSHTTRRTPVRGPHALRSSPSRGTNMASKTAATDRCIESSERPPFLDAYLICTALRTAMWQNATEEATGIVKIARAERRRRGSCSTASCAKGTEDSAGVVCSRRSNSFCAAVFLPSFSSLIRPCCKPHCAPARRAPVIIF